MIPVAMERLNSRLSTYALRGCQDPFSGRLKGSQSRSSTHYGVQASDLTTVESMGDEFSTAALKSTAMILGAGIVTGVVAGAIIGVVQRWHDYEK